MFTMVEFKKQSMKIEFISARDVISKNGIFLCIKQGTKIRFTAVVQIKINSLQIDSCSE